MTSGGPYADHMARTQTIVQLSSEMVEALDQEALRTGVSRSALIRDAIQEHLQGSREAQITAQLVSAYTEMPQGVEDEWGDLGEQMLDSTRRTIRRLDREEEVAGLEW